MYHKEYGVDAVMQGVSALAKASDAELISASSRTGDSLDALNLVRLLCQRAGQSCRAAKYESGPKTANPE